ncbi:Protein spinster 1 [Lonchura striata]|uniref:Protein spinster 1 n=1 Tax=Lonchura striata TaxID=40157 RepID=A0A218UAM2_9PASE|nr:Protein spinster 1 [Lonchura striata domestica]
MGGENVFLFVPNLIGYARILLAAVSFWLMPTRPGPAAACYGAAALLDAVDGHAARALGQGTGYTGLDWFGLVWTGLDCSALQGASSHKVVGGEGHPLLRRYYQCRDPSPPMASPCPSPTLARPDDVTVGAGPDPALAPPPAGQAPPPAPHPRLSVAILCLINLVNYMDRFTVAGVLPEVEDYFGIGDSSSGLLQTGHAHSGHAHPGHAPHGHAHTGPAHPGHAHSQATPTQAMPTRSRPFTGHAPTATPTQPHPPRPRPPCHAHPGHAHRDHVHSQATPTPGHAHRDHVHSQATPTQATPTRVTSTQATPTRVTPTPATPIHKPRPPMPAHPGHAHSQAMPTAGHAHPVFISSYLVLAPLFGFLGDRHSRKRLLALGLGLWSGVTLATSFVPPQHFGVLLAGRALVGVGEAAYSTLAPTLVADLYRGPARSRALGAFYLAVPLGSRTLVLSTLGFTAVAFVTGALALWAPAFLFRVRLARGEAAPCRGARRCRGDQS